MKRILLAVVLVTWLVAPAVVIAASVMLPTGDGGYVGDDGTYYSSAGSAGVVNSETG